MTTISRRSFNKMAAGVAATGALTAPYISRAATAKPNVIVIGGGAGGATTARYIAKESNGTINVVLIEPSKRYYSCFFSNLYLGGFRDYESLGHGYRALAVDHGINVVHDLAMTIDRQAKSVTLSSGGKLSYDRLVLSPGIDLKYGSVPGYSPAAASIAPHAYKSGTQVQLLKAKVEAMKEGGVFIMVAPPNPYRCPPGPYERISMIATLLKKKNPKAKLIILDPKENFSKQSLFQAGWNAHYPGMIEWIPASTSGPVQNFDMDAMTFETDLETFKADAANIIPAQSAGRIAHQAELVDKSGWCPIHPATMQSQFDDNVYILGDAAIAAAMPKSAFSANSQAKVVANQIRHALVGTRNFPARYNNTCWSLIAKDDGVKIGAAYQAGEKAIEATSKFISKPDESNDVRSKTYEESVAWYASITKDMFS
ncbi:MAG: FCSD flavin-binding domain-containing protein [Hyphomicrobiaceae bacterium]